MTTMQTLQSRTHILLLRILRVVLSKEDDYSTERNDGTQAQTNAYTVVCFPYLLDILFLFT